MIGRFAETGRYRELLRSRDFLRIAAAGGLVLASYLWDRGSPSGTTVGIALALGAIILNGVPILWEAIRGLVKRRVNVDELVALALVACVVRGEFLTAGVVSFVMVFGALIEEFTSDSARKAIEALIEVAPDSAVRLVDGKAETVCLGDVRVGDTLLVRPGERIPVDAVVAKGAAAVDESPMTGEPIPKEKTIGDAVFAGTLDQNGVIEVRATKVGEDTTLSKVIQLVSEAESHKPKAMRLIDRYARWFTPTILTCALATWLVTGDLDRFTAVLIVGCPCALILAAPTAVVATIGRAARAGILVKGGLYLEEVARADVVLFDKTGTLTEGKPEIDEIAPADGRSAGEVLSMAASVEQDSTHPLAHAVTRAAESRGIAFGKAQDVRAEIGLGVHGTVDGRFVKIGSTYLGAGSEDLPDGLRERLRAFRERGATPLVVYEDEQAVGVISVADQVRPAAGDTMAALRNLGFRRMGLLSGDHDLAAQMVAGAVGIEEVWAGMKPEDKLDVIRGFQEEGHKVLFVGDGINDAPALASANVGVAMGAIGTDVALETADVALMHDDITKLAFLIRLSRRMLGTIKWNIAFGMVFNAFAVAASGTGLLTPILGAVVHNIGSVLVVISSASIAITSDRNRTASARGETSGENT